MARQYWGINRGQTEFQVATSSSTTGDDFEVSYNAATVDGDAGMGRQEFLQALEMIKNNILKGNWPPA